MGFMRLGASRSQLDIHCIAEIAPERACWKPVPPDGTAPVCSIHRNDPHVVLSVRLARYVRGVSGWQREWWRGEVDVPWSD